MKAQELILWLSKLGVSNDMPVYKQKSIILYNLIVRILVFFYIIGEIIVRFVMRFELLADLFLLVIPILVYTVYLNLKGRVETSLFVMANILPIVVMFITIYSKIVGEGNDIIVYTIPRFSLIMFTIIPAVIIGFESRKKAFANMIIGMLCYVFYDQIHLFFGVDYRKMPFNMDLYPIQIIILAAMIISILALIFFMHNTNSEYENIVINQRAELIARNEEIIAQRDEIEVQRDEIIEQKRLIEKKSSDLTSSIQYAQRIQKAILPKEFLLNKYFPQNFIFFKPRDIVSGDFYWIREVDRRLFVMAADCTGHGVPGAFMSMLGASLMNEIIKQAQKYSAGEVLDKLRLYLKEVLQQSGAMGEQQDGIDTALCIFDFDQNELQFAGAYNPLYIIRNDQLLEFKSDRMPIGIHPHDTIQFNNLTIPLFNNDLLYIFSDGFHSQVGGGERNEKYKTYRLKEFLLSVHSETLPKQYELLEKELSNWQGEKQQVDDILLLGMKFLSTS